MLNNSNVELYEKMTPVEQLAHLRRLSFNLTVVSRNTYTVGADGVDRPKALRGLVEICHKVLGRAQSIESGGFIVIAEHFWNSLYATAEIFECLFELESAISFSNEGWEVKQARSE